MSSLKSQSPLKHPQTHSPSFPPLTSQGYCISEKEMEVRGSGSPQSFPVIHAQLAGLPWFPALSAMSLGSPVLHPNPRDTFSWPTSKSAFTLFLPTASLLHSSKLLRESFALLLHLVFQLLKLHGKGSPKTAWFHPKMHSSTTCPKPHVSPNLTEDPVALPCVAAATGLNPGANIPLHPHF